MIKFFLFLLTLTSCNKNNDKGINEKLIIIKKMKLQLKLILQMVKIYLMEHAPLVIFMVMGEVSSLEIKLNGIK